VEAATTELLKRPYIDPTRVYATGGSYGGYMVAWMNGHVPAGRYAAYVCHAGCFDWTAMFADDAWAWHAKELGGLYWDDMARVHGQSPHAFAKNFRTPTLVIHGAPEVVHLAVDLHGDRAGFEVYVVQHEGAGLEDIAPLHHGAIRACRWAAMSC
jgi:dienelactone hydrolase